MLPEQTLTGSLLIAAAGIIALVMLTARRRRWRDPVRFFTREQKKVIYAIAGGRCEHKAPLGRRCRQKGREADHVVPWSRGGPTQLWNSQLLCVQHNQDKSAWMPSRLYRYRLRRRRRRYPI